MNRMEELQELLNELEEPVPALEDTVNRARRRKAKRNRRITALVSVAAVFVLFVGLVNFSTPVAYACSKIPIIKELAEAVTFSPSLSDAVENEFVQPMNLYKEDGGVSATVEYLIVDQKQVNVFFRLDSEHYAGLGTDPKVKSADGSSPTPCAYGLSEWDVENGELRCLTIDFMDEDVPQSLLITMDIYDRGDVAAGEPMEVAAPENISDDMFSDMEEPRMYVAYFEFLLEFDPLFTAAGKVFDINETIEMDGQQITFTQMEVYPTHLRVNVEESGKNTAWLKSLDFYIETDWGMQFDTISNGISATGSEDGKSMASFRADSSYFYEAEHLEIVITGVEWLNKDMEKMYLNLETGETGQLPEGVRFKAATKQAEGWILEFEAQYRRENHHHQLFASEFYDAAGERYEINSWSSTFGEENENGEISYFIEEFPLKDYHETEVWLCPHYSHMWTPEEPVRIEVK
ncbi:MAG: DUF4179 domain-containing protein [Lachnospiraceae bacterium]|nr:DUF4179 domain-containing protein [Lachnospiraceae bacterium]